jgi:hypothetical protein
MITWSECQDFNPVAGAVTSARRPAVNQIPHYSFDTTSFSDIDAAVAAIMMTATAVRPTT